MIRTLIQRLSFCVLLVSGCLHADETWNGGGSPNIFDWGQANNWTPAGPPTAANIAVFGNTATNFTPTISSISSMPSYDVLGIEFTVSTPSGPYTLTIDDGKTLNIGTSGVSTSNSGILPLTNTIAVFGSGLLKCSGNFDGSPINSLMVCHIDGSTVQFLGSGQLSNGLFQVVNNSALEFLDHSIVTGGSIKATGGGTVSFLDNSEFATGGDIVLGASSMPGHLTFDGLSRCTGGSVNVDFNSTVDFVGSSACSGGDFTFISSTLTFKGNSTCSGGVFTLNEFSSVEFDEFSTATGGTFKLRQQFDFLTFNIDGIIGSGVSIDFSPISVNSQVVFNPTNQLIFEGTISGMGPDATDQILMNGSGTLIIDSNSINTSTVQWIVNDGTLVLNGSVGGNVQVMAGAVLEGTGNIGGNLLMSGTVAPAPGFNGLAGPLTVGGDYSDNPGAIYDVLIDANGNNSEIIVAGNASITNTNVNVVIDGSRAIIHGLSADIFHADGTLTGPFASFNVFGVTNPLYEFSLEYLPHDVLFLITFPAEKFLETENQKHVARALNSIFNPNPDQFVWLTALANLPPSEVPNALDQIGGEQYTNYIEVSYNATNRFSNRLKMATRSRVLCPRRCESDLFGWFDAGGGKGDYDGDSLSKGLDSRNYFMNGGIQVLNDCGWTFGIAASYEKEDLDFDLNGSASADMYQGAFYTAVSNENGYLLANFIYGCNHFKMKRHIEFGDIDRTAHSDGRVWAGTFYSEVGLTNSVGCVACQQYAGADFGYYYQKKMQEKGAHTLDLEIDALKCYRYDFVLGSRFQLRLPCAVSVELDLDYRHRFNAQRIDITTLLKDTTIPIKLKGFKLGKNGLEGSLTLLGTICGDLQWYLRATGQCWSHYKDFSGTTGFILHW